MLQNVHVKNLALIDEVEIEFHDGLNILTGETGAGKSIILGSVNLALGGKYTKDILREGSDYGFVELVFSVDDENQKKKLEELDVFPEENVVILSRRLMEKRSVSRVNGETVTLSKLKDISSVLIDIHGQHEHQSLLYKKNHLLLVDAYAKEQIDDWKNKTAKCYKEYKICKKKLAEADMDEAQRTKELSFLKFELSEIESAELKIGEDEELESIYRKITNSKKIADNLMAVYDCTHDSTENVADKLSRAIRYMADAAQYGIEAVEQLYTQLVEIDSLLNDFNHDLSTNIEDSSFSDEEFYRVEDRLNLINHLKTKYGNTVEDILNYAEEQKQKIEQLEDYENYVSDLRMKLEQSEKELLKVVNILTKKRKEQAEILEKEITKGLKELNFAEVQFEIHFDELEDYTANGKDDVEFKISLNPGLPVRSLVHVASGGELSRIMLAIKTVMADRDEIATLIFDEIDVGISGRTAQKVSEKMELIGKNHQVICITHLAQIAAMADCHYLIEKTVGEKDTTTDIRMLNEQESVAEIARILGGAKITEAVLKNAVEMKELAKQLKTEN